MIDKLKKHLKENNITNVEQLQIHLQQKLDDMNKAKGTNYTLANLLESIDITPEQFIKKTSELFKQ